jgi:polysaccharide biosynthesis/export protein
LQARPAIFSLPRPINSPNALVLAEFGHSIAIQPTLPMGQQHAGQTTLTIVLFPGSKHMARTTSFMFVVVLAATLLPAGAANAQTPPLPPPGTPPAEIQRQVERQGGAEVLRQRLRESGMTHDQIRRRLASMGYDPQTLDAYLRADTIPAPEPTAGTLRALGAIGMADITEDLLADPRPEPAGVTEDEERLGLRVFGVEVFSRGSSAFEAVTNTAVPSTYVLGPGDELVLVLTGDVEQVHTLAVTREGFVLIPQVGQVWVNGLTLDRLRDQLYNRLGAVYSGVRRGAGATTHFDISVARLRTNQVYITGEVARPGGYLASPMASVLNALYQAGGPTANGSFREVQVLRSGSVIHRVDLYQFLLRGDNLDRVRMEPGDVIYVPPRGNQVSIRGEVTRAAIYEMLPGESFLDLLAFAGGVRAPAHLRRARVTRVVPAPLRTTPGFDRVVLDVDLAEAIRNPQAAPRLESGDEVHVLAVRDEVRNIVSLNGAVWRPGSYAYLPGMTAWDLIARADGLSSEAYDGRAHISRLDRGTGSLSLIPFSLVLNPDGTPAENPALAEFDVVTIYTRADTVAELNIEVAGAVRQPGAERFQQGMTLRDAIIRAGGLRRVADPVVEVSRLADPDARAAGRIAQIYRIPVDTSYFVSDESATFYLGDPHALRARFEAGAAAEFVLQPHDRIFVRELPNFEMPRVVTLEGEARYPGQYALQSKEERLRDIIVGRAGGLTQSAHAGGFRLYRNGSLINVDLESVLASPNHRDNIVMMPGDSMVLPEYNPVVMVTGAVNSPTSVMYRQGAGLDYYISNAGGFARDADKGRVHVRYANGAGRAVGRGTLGFRSKPVPAPGSVVTVPHVLPDDRFDLRGAIADVTQIAAALATVIVLLRR